MILFHPWYFFTNILYARLFQVEQFFYKRNSHHEMRKVRYIFLSYTANVPENQCKSLTDRLCRIFCGTVNSLASGIRLTLNMTVISYFETNYVSLSSLLQFCIPFETFRYLTMQTILGLCVLLNRWNNTFFHERKSSINFLQILYDSLSHIVH